MFIEISSVALGLYLVGAVFSFYFIEGYSNVPFWKLPGLPKTKVILGIFFELLAVGFYFLSLFMAWELRAPFMEGWVVGFVTLVTLIWGILLQLGAWMFLDITLHWCPARERRPNPV